MDKQPSTGMSKKAFSAGMAITAIGSCDDLHTQIVIAVVAAIAIGVQGFLDWRKQQS